MADTMKGLKRTHYCGTVTPEMIGRGSGGMRLGTENPRYGHPRLYRCARPHRHRPAGLR